MGVSLGLGWRASRPYSYPASAVPVLLGTAAAWVFHGQFHLLRVILALVGVMALHGASNIFNDYYDYKKGVDGPDTIGTLGILVTHEIEPRPLVMIGLLYYGIGVASGLILWWMAGNWVLWLGLIGVAGGFFYTWGPAFKFRLLGDVSVFVLFGLLVTLGAFYIQAGELSWVPVLYAIPLGLLIDGILHGNNLRDIPDDNRVNVTTLAGYLGVEKSKIFYLFLVAGAFLSIPVLVFVDHLPWPAFLVVLSLPLAVRNVKRVFEFTRISREHLSSIDAMSAQLQMVFGVLMTIGVVLGKWV
jgi:1,4-dihydroxy-2-naphthoate polyprenyltransferase